VNSFIGGIDVTLGVARTVLLILFGFVALVCVVDWAVRTRRISPFSGVARFFRASIDPLLVPVERRIVRAGGLPSNAPWWALGTVVVGGIAVLYLLGFLRDQLMNTMSAASGGALPIYSLLVSWTFTILRVALIVRVVVSWTRISPYSTWVRWSFVLTEPIIRPLRRLVPTIGMIDLTPLVAYFLLWLLEKVFIVAGATVLR
jgi:YggT family protein